MAKNKKVEILSNDKEVLHPMTDGDCVIFEDGQTLAQKLSEDDSVKYTPEIVNSSPMFKVGEGNTVDYSDNVLDGAYERATLQGQTYVNYIQESSADEVTLPTPFTEYERTQHNTLTSNEEGTLGINLVGQSYVNALQHDSEEEFVVLGESLEFQEKKVEYTNEGQIKSAMLKGQTLVNIFKSFANYTYSASEVGVKWLITGSASLTETVNNDELTMTLTGVGSKVVRIDDVSMLKPNTKYMVKVNYTTSFGGEIYFGWLDNSIFYTQITSMKSNEYAIFTTPSDLSTWVGLWFGILGDLQTGDTIKISKPVLIEYQEGMENWDIPYFEGMQSVTMSTELENVCSRYNSSGAKNGKTFTVGTWENRGLTLSTTDNISKYNFKPNTKYLVQFKVTNLNLDGLSSMKIAFSDGEVSTGNSLFGDNALVEVKSNGIYRGILTTSNVISTSNFVIKGLKNQWEGSGSSLRSLTISNIMCVEYQNGMENWDLPYFEDYQVMKPVQVESINKNLQPQGTYTTNTSNNVSTLNDVNGYIRVVPGKKYRISCGAEIAGCTMRWFDRNKKLLEDANGIYREAPANAYYMRLLINTDLDYLNTVQVEESADGTNSDYIDNESKTTYSWDEVILRKVGDVEDTLDLTTGEWVQRIGEIILDGSDDETWQQSNETWQQVTLDTWTKTNGVQDSCGYIYYFQHNYKAVDYITFHEQESNLYTLCDKLPVSGFNTELSSKTNVCVAGGATPSTIQNGTINTYIGIKLDTTKATTLDEFKAWLKQNPLKVHVVMNKPIVHKVNLSRPNLQVYDDITHVHTKCLDGTLIPNIYLPSDVSYPAILESNTTYNVCVNHTEVSADNPLKVNVGGTEITMTDSRMTLTTPATLANSNVSFTGKGNKIKESMLIKNSSLLTRDLPHFNGIGSVQLGKTIENLCGSNCYMSGVAAISPTFGQNSVQFTITKAGSCVWVFPIIRPLINGKKYFVYAPNTYPSASSAHVSFRHLYDNQLTFAYGEMIYPISKYTTFTINQDKNQFSHIVIGNHGSVPLNSQCTLTYPIICEYEPGMENWDWESIGYFTGTKNIGNEFMRVQNKNFYPYGDSSFTAQQGNMWCWLNGKGCSFGANCIKKNMGNVFYLKKGSYVMNYDDNNSIQGVQLVGEYEKMANVKNIEQDGWYALRVKTTTDNIPVNITNIQIEELSTATTYTAHKHNGLYITKDQPIELTWEQGRINPSGIGDSYTNAINNAVSYGIRTKGLLNLKPNTTYRLSLGDKANFKYSIAVFDNWDNALPSVASLGISGDWISSIDTIFTTTKDAHKIGINVQKQNASSITSPESVHVQVRLEEVTDVVLRSCSGKYDELDLTRGTYTQNVGIVYLDGMNTLSQQITVVGDTYQPTNKTLKSFDIRCVGAVLSSKCSCNKFPSRDGGITSVDISFESVCIHSSNQSCRLTISTEKASTLEEFKLWLQDNPLEIIYTLKTPIVHKVHIGNKNEANTEVTKPNDVFTLPTLYTEQTHIDLTNNGIMPKVQSRDYIAYPVLPMINRTYTLQHNLTGGVSNLTVDLLGRTQEITYQNHKSLVYTPETMDAKLHDELRISGKGKINKVMYVDGGYMDRDIPYIEGMKNAVNPIVKNYTDTQENICYVDCGDETIYLRSLPNGVHDEIDLETGKYIQRVGEITFNGTESWSVGYASWQNKYTYYNNGFVDIKLAKNTDGNSNAYYDALRCPQLHRSYMSRLASASIDGVCAYYYSGYQRIFISKQDCATVNELKLWLKENPITVQYELPEPIVKDIVIHNYPHSYEGGHVIIENGDPNTPIPAQLTYRAVTNRSGQIQQHTEQVEKQEREINELETLILANIHLSQTR